jgi:hypothetical protein
LTVNSSLDTSIAALTYYCLDLYSSFDLESALDSSFDLNNGLESWLLLISFLINSYDLEATDSTAAKALHSDYSRTVVMV